MSAIDKSRERPLLRLGDEPEDLARGRILADLLEAEGRAPVVRYPRKGVASPPTMLRGGGTKALDAEWLTPGVIARVPANRRWLLDIAGASPEAGPGTGRPSPTLGPTLGPSLSPTLAREIRVLLSSARRSAAHDLAHAFRALSGNADEVRRDVRLRAFREEAARAVTAALKARPVFSWRVALASYCSAESVEEVVAARWRDKLTGYVVLASNPAYVSGRVVFAFRSGPEIDGGGIILSALPGARSAARISGDGHSGRGSLPSNDFGKFLENLKFGKEVRSHG